MGMCPLIVCTLKTKMASEFSTGKILETLKAQDPENKRPQFHNYVHLPGTAFSSGSFESRGTTPAENLSRCVRLCADSERQLLICFNSVLVKNENWILLYSFSEAKSGVYGKFYSYRFLEYLGPCLNPPLFHDVF